MGDGWQIPAGEAGNIPAERLARPGGDGSAVPGGHTRGDGGAREPTGPAVSWARRMGGAAEICSVEAALRPAGAADSAGGRADGVEWPVCAAAVVWGVASRS